MLPVAARSHITRVAQAFAPGQVSVLAKRASTSTSKPAESRDSNNGNGQQQTSDKSQKHPDVTKKKTTAELDEELRLKMQGISGDGGEAGVEYEDGQPVAMKRGVKENMFRLI